MTELHPQQSDARLASTMASGLGLTRPARGRREHPLPDQPKSDEDASTGKRDSTLFDRLRWGTAQEPVIEALNGQ
jgi:hypothetical protein